MGKNAEYLNSNVSGCGSIRMSVMSVLPISSPKIWPGSWMIGNEIMSPKLWLPRLFVNDFVELACGELDATESTAEFRLKPLVDGSTNVLLRLPDVRLRRRFEPAAAFAS